MQIELEALAKSRVQAWEAELAQRNLLSRIPRKTPFWRHWLGKALVQVGKWLTRWGEWLSLREYTQELPLSNNKSSITSVNSAQ